MCAGVKAKSVVWASVQFQPRKIFVGGLSWDTTDDSLRDYFSTYGKVTEAKVVLDRDTGRSRGFGFVTFDEESCAENCICQGSHNLDNREVNVSHAHDRQR